MIISDEFFDSIVPISLQNSKSFISALSGGADSLCLTLLLAIFAKRHQKRMKAVIIDHKLRPESSAEILPIIEIIKSFGINFEIKVWKHEVIESNIEKKAREARYNLLYQACKDFGGDVIAVAHHALDQWETFFMRLSKGSPISGLSVMKPTSPFKEKFICRPLLEIDPESLKQTLKSRFNIDKFVNDPSNQDEIFERVRWRKNFELLSTRFGLSLDNIIRTVKRLQNTEEYLNITSLQQYSQCFSNNYINLTYFNSLHDEIKIRVLRQILREVSESPYRIISFSLLEKTIFRMSSKSFKCVNISGCILQKDKTKNVKVKKELRIKR